MQSRLDNLDSQMEELLRLLKDSVNKLERSKLAVASLQNQILRLMEKSVRKEIKVRTPTRRMVDVQRVVSRKAIAG